MKKLIYVTILSNILFFQPLKIYSDSNIELIHKICALDSEIKNVQFLLKMTTDYSINLKVIIGNLNYEHQQLLLFYKQITKKEFKNKFCKNENRITFGAIQWAE